MATDIYVRSKVSLQCRVDEIPDKDNHPLKESKQRHDQWDCQTRTISKCEWEWRFETAKLVLCSGTTPARETYSGDVIGGYWDCTTGITTNEGLFNER